MWLYYWLCNDWIFLINDLRKNQKRKIIYLVSIIKFRTSFNDLFIIKDTFVFYYLMNIQNGITIFMGKKIIDFLSKQTVASISCIKENGQPYSFSCFYVFNREDNLFYFKSSDTSYHISLLLKNHAVSGTVLPDKLNTLKFNGIQFSGQLLDLSTSLCDDAATHYHKTFPVALTIPGTVRTIQLNVISMTSSLLGRMQKVQWQREANQRVA